MLKLNQKNEDVSNQNKNLHYFYFILTTNSKKGNLLIRVDDFIHMGSKNFKEKVSQPLNQTFKIGKHSDTSFKYV